MMAAMTMASKIYEGGSFRATRMQFSLWQTPFAFSSSLWLLRFSSFFFSQFVAAAAILEWVFVSFIFFPNMCILWWGYVFITSYNSRNVPIQIFKWSQLDLISSRYFSPTYYLFTARPFKSSYFNDRRTSICRTSECKLWRYFLFMYVGHMNTSMNSRC